MIEEKGNVEKKETPPAASPKREKRPAMKSKTESALASVEELAKESGLKPWETAGLLQAVGWTADKRVDAQTFALALEAFRTRPQGGGKCDRQNEFWKRQKNIGQPHQQFVQRTAEITGQDPDDQTYRCADAAHQNCDD